jgi:putative aminopeptidase FrvX
MRTDSGNNQQMKASHYRLLAALLTKPTAPFREEHVVRFVRATLGAAGVPHLLDPSGNIVVGCASRAAYRKLVRTTSEEPLRLFIAHMDHPGFHGVLRRTDGSLAVRWHGGSPTRHLAGARVWLANEDGVLGHGTLAKARLGRGRHAIATATVRVARDDIGVAPREIYGGFAFRAPVWRRGKRVYTKAADDLVGVYAILRTAIDLFRRSRRGSRPFLGVLTRAEEVGFVGALAHLEFGWLKGARRPLLAVSLESSRTLPGALVGKGPVVRLGDRRTVFDADGLRVLTDIANRVLPKRHQRRIMDGGTCEATAATAYGIPAIGISVPLGNYHNEGFETPQRKRGPAPEFVHLDDVEGMVTLCRALMEPGLPWDNPWAETQQRLRRHSRKYRRLLNSRSGKSEKRPNHRRRK